MVDRRAQELRHDLLKRRVGPNLAGATEEHAIGTRILAARHDSLKSRESMALEILFYLGIGFFSRRPVPVCGHQPIVNRLLGTGRGRRRGEVAKVAVEINVVFVHAPQPSKSIGIEGMYQGHTDSLRQPFVDTFDQKSDLAAGPAEAPRHRAFPKLSPRG